MGIAERRVGDEQPFLLADPGGELFRTQLAELVARPRRKRARTSIPSIPSLTLPAGTAPAPVGAVVGDRLATHLRIAVDYDLGNVLQQLRGPVLPFGQLEEGRRFVDELVVTR